MKRTRRYAYVLPAALLLLAAFASTTIAQVTCTASAAAPLLVRAEGKTEPVGDLILTCTGGTPTAVGLQVPQVNFTVFLNTNLTSQITQDAPTIDFSEALLLVDEPNSLVNPPERPLLNCGQEGAPDKTALGPGVCAVISSGIVTATYDGTQNISGTVPCDGVAADPAPNSNGCGRPNVFQARRPSGGGSDNVVEFLGVPFDPPGLGTRIFRFTNLRSNASILGLGGPFPIMVDIAVSGAMAVIINNPEQTVGFSQTSLLASIVTPNVVHLEEGFASAWKDRNVAFTLLNATFGGGGYTYNGGTGYPAQAAQNVPGVEYNDEDLFQWQNNLVNGPPTPNPPAGFGGGPVPNLGNPLSSALAFGGVNTNIDQAGVSSAGTRIALTFKHVPGHSTVTVPASVLLHPVASPGTNSGVMILTGTDAAGAGPFTPGASTTIADGGTAVYEVLYADPFQLEMADIDCVVNHTGNGTRVEVSYAPFYSNAASGNATPTKAHPTPTAVPRFIPASGKLMLSK